MIGVMGPPFSPMIDHLYARHPSTGYAGAAPGRRTRSTGWDVICTVALWVVLVLAAGTAMWLSPFFGFATDTCPTAGCPAVPVGIDELIYPVTWGGIGVAFAVAVIGPLVSLWRRWYMLIWPAVATGIVIASFLAGFAMTAFSQQYL